MTAQYYDFFGELSVELSGIGGRTARQYTAMFDHFRVDSLAADPDIVIRETENDIETETVLGEPENHYGWTGERFVVRTGSEYMAVTPGWSQVLVTPGFEPFESIYPIEFRIRQGMAERGKALCHGSAVRFDGHTTVFPAWRSAGKTNTLFSLLQAGADFLSDDRLWVGADRTAVGYPLGVNLQPFNIESFSQVEATEETAQGPVGYKLHRFVTEHLNGNGSLPATGVRYLYNRYLADNSRDFTDVRSLFPSSEVVERATVDSVVFLEAEPDARTITTEPIGVDRAMRAVTAISNFEWDGQLREQFHAYDAFAGDDFVDQLEAVIRKERAAFRELFESVPVYRASVPRERDWSENRLDETMVETIAELNAQDPQKREKKP